MEILPGEGVAQAKVGESRELVESRLGPPMHPGRDSRAVYATSPMLVLTFTEDDKVELVELSCSGDGEEEVFFDGVQLTWRFLDEVVADLAAKGYRAEPHDRGYRFAPGFVIFSTGSRWARDLDPDASEDDPRAICEGVSVAPDTYFDGPTEEAIEDYIRKRVAAHPDGPDAETLRRMIEEGMSRTRR